MVKFYQGKILFAINLVQYETMALMALPHRPTDDELSGLASLVLASAEASTRFSGLSEVEIKYSEAHKALAIIPINTGATEQLLLDWVRQIAAVLMLPYEKCNMPEVPHQLTAHFIMEDDNLDNPVWVTL